MKRTPRTLLAAAAMAGLLNGAVILQTRADGTNTTSSTNSVSAGKDADSKAKPTVHGCSGMNDCKGVGGCKSGDKGCKFLNTCKGKGGCEITAKDVEDWKKKQKDDDKDSKK